MYKAYAVMNKVPSNCNDESRCGAARCRHPLLCLRRPASLYKAYQVINDVPGEFAEEG